DGIYACPQGEEEEDGGEGEDSDGDDAVGEDTAGGEIDGDGNEDGLDEGGLDQLPTSASNLSRGVLLVHHPPGLQYSAGIDYCAYARDSLSSSDCREDVNPTVPLDAAASVWFVIAAWSEAKEFAGVEFGFGHYDEQAYAIVDHGPCFPDSGSELADAGWPGPLAGTSLTATTAWQGEFVPVYYFAGYAYSEAEIAIQGREPGALAKITNALALECEVWASRCGVLGLGRSGVTPCPSMSLTQEVLVRFVPGGIELPSGTSHATPAEVTASSAGFRPLLSEFSVRHIAKSFPGAVRDATGFICRSGQTVHLTDVTDHYRLLVADSVQALELASSLATDPSVLQATVDVLEADLCVVWPNEFDLPHHNHWHLHNDRWADPEVTCLPDVDIDAPQAWDIIQGSSMVRIGVLDSPIFVGLGNPQEGHEDLRHGRIIRQDDGHYPVHYHGTAVTGVIASWPNNGLGTVGVDWEAEIYGYDVNRHLGSVNTDAIAYGLFRLSGGRIC
ncbi:MAG: hypothetical protein FJY75_06290, partial [Candidatus Eisenbacteria bacterium]|nr:hypothetical protein [Candidatus Eisenbacteria bacterium]